MIKTIQAQHQSFNFRYPPLRNNPSVPPSAHPTPSATVFSKGKNLILTPASKHSQALCEEKENIRPEESAEKKVVVVQVLPREPVRSESEAGFVTERIGVKKAKSLQFNKENIFVCQSVVNDEVRKELVSLIIAICYRYQSHASDPKICCLATKLLDLFLLNYDLLANDLVTVSFACIVSASAHLGLPLLKTPPEQLNLLPTSCSASEFKMLLLNINSLTSSVSLATPIDCFLKLCSEINVPGRLARLGMMIVEGCLYSVEISVERPSLVAAGVAGILVRIKDWSLPMTIDKFARIAQHPFPEIFKIGVKILMYFSSFVRNYKYLDDCPLLLKYADDSNLSVSLLTVILSANSHKPHLTN